MLYIYVFCLIFGGVLLGASILLGGKDSPEADAHAQPAESVQPAEYAHPDGVFSAVVSSLRSTRFWTFFFAFFGLTGVTLEGLALTGPTWTLALALGMGIGSGALAAAALRALQNERSGVPPSARDYVGKTARVLVRVEAGSVGKVRLELNGRTVDVLARLADGEESFAPREEATIIQMDGTEARIARIDRTPS